MKQTIGDLRERVCLERQAFIPDDLGGYTITWAQGQTVWAQIKPLKSKALSLAADYSNRKKIRKTYYIVRFRYGMGINPGDRLKWGRLSLHIVDEPIWDPCNQWLDVIAYSIRRSS